MTLVGFRRMTIGIFDEDGFISEADKFVVEGTQDEGATVTAEITGLSKEATKVYGSDLAYYVAQKGTGDVSVNFGLLDLPEEVNNKILGYKQSESGISFIGEDTEPPYLAVMMESEDLSGEKALLSVFKGKMGMEAITLNTLTGDTFEPEAESYVLTAVASDADNESKGQTVGKYVGSDDAALTELEEMTFPTDPGAAGE